MTFRHHSFQKIFWCALAQRDSLCLPSQNCSSRPDASLPLTGGVRHTLLVVEREAPGHLQELHLLYSSASSLGIPSQRPFATSSLHHHSQIPVPVYASEMSATAERLPQPTPALLHLCGRCLGQCVATSGINRTSSTAQLRQSYGPFLI